MISNPSTVYCLPSQAAGKWQQATAKALRQSATQAEVVLWPHLRNRRLGGFQFRRQHPIGHYIADFACAEAMLVIEADGGGHADSKSEDEARTAFLQSQGWEVRRFWNDEIMQNTDDVLSAILSAAEKRAKAKLSPRNSTTTSSHPPPLGGGASALALAGGGMRGEEKSTPRERAVAPSHPPPQAAEGEKLEDNRADVLASVATLSAAEKRAKAKLSPRNSATTSSHPPPLGGGASALALAGGGMRGEEKSTPRERAVAPSHPPPQAAEGEKLEDNRADESAKLAADISKAGG